MKYQVVKNINGERENEVIDTYKTIEEAREQLLRELTFAVGDDYTVIENEEAALHEIEVINTEFREDWGDERSDSYIAAIESCMGNYPFAVDCVDFDTVETSNDRFSYDNFSIYIEEFSVKATVDIYSSNAIIYIGDHHYNVDGDGYEDLSTSDVDYFIRQDIIDACENAGIEVEDLENYDEVVTLLGIFYDKYTA